MNFRSTDGRFGLCVPPEAVTRIAEFRRDKDPDETGGILLGRYTEDHSWGIVTTVSGPPTDSRHGPTWFHRGVRGLQGLLTRLWKANEAYYLGEWHSHPESRVTPSGTDQTQLNAISSDGGYSCPEPVLLISGGKLVAPTMAAYVYPRDESPVQLQPTEDAPSPDDLKQDA